MILVPALITARQNVIYLPKGVKSLDKFRKKNNVPQKKITKIIGDQFCTHPNPNRVNNNILLVSASTPGIFRSIV